MDRLKFVLMIILLGLLSLRVEAQNANLTGLFPAGGQIGSTVEVSLIGTIPEDIGPLHAHVDRSGLRVEPLEATGKVRVLIEDDAVPGRYWIRFTNVQSAFDPQPFLVGTLPERLEVEPNDANDHAEAIGDQVSVVINSRFAESGDVDTFAITMEEGQILVADLDAHEAIGSPLDAILQVASRDGFVLHQVNDSPGLDPRLVYRAPHAGTFLVRTFCFPETPNSSIRFAGGETYVYRLTLTTGGALLQTHPSVVSILEPVGDRSPLQPIGENLSFDLVEDALQIDPIDDETSRVWAPGLAGTVDVLRVSHRVIVEGESADDTLGWEPPLTIGGRISEPHQTDRYPIAIRKDRALRIRVEAHAIGSPLDPVLILRSEDGSELKRIDDNRGELDPTHVYQSSHDGRVFVELSDLYGRGSPEMVYRIHVEEPTPQVDLWVDSNRIVAPPGETVSLQVKIDRRDGYAEPVDLTVIGLPHGVLTSTATSRVGDDSAKSITLRIRVNNDAPAWSGPIRVVGCPRGGDDRYRIATAPLLRNDRTATIWLTIPPRNDFLTSE